MGDLQQLARVILGGKSISLPSGSWPHEASRRLAVLCLTTIALLFVRLQIMGSQLPVFTRFVHVFLYLIMLRKLSAQL